MSLQDLYHLEEHLLLSLGGKHLQSLGSTLLRSGSLSFKDLAGKLPEMSQQECSNTLAILIKHNLARAWVSEFDQITYYTFDERECVLRLSAPRYFVKLRGKYSPTHQAVAETIFLYGSLLRSEVAELVTDDRAQGAIEDLIQDNYLVSAQSYFEGAEKPAQTLNKRQQKEEDKKGMKDKKEVDHDFPIRVNMIKFLAEERRQVIIDFAKAKLHASQQDLDNRIFAFIVNREENISQYVVAKTDPKEKLLYPTFTWQTIQHDYQSTEGKSLPDKDLQLTLKRLFKDSTVQFLLKTSVDHKTQADVYQVNWQGVLEAFQEQMQLRIVEETMGRGHGRVLRALKVKGYLEEKDIISMCLLQVKDAQRLINQLLSEGFVQQQEVQVKQQGNIMLYGLNPQTWKKKLTYRIGKTCFNLLERQNGFLGLHANLSQELNHLYF